MMASRTPLWRILPVGASLLWLGLLSSPGHALTLGDLAVSSRPAPSFNASLPFSDDKTVRLSELQTRIATDAEYAQWGLQMPKDVRQLRIRVVPASKTVGYIELYSLNPLTQDSFDLLVWASYAGQTILTRYKVVLLDMPSLIKGKTLSASSAAQTQQTPTTYAKAKKAQASTVNQAPSPALNASEPGTSSQDTPTSSTNVEATASESAAPEIRSAASETPPPTAAIAATSEAASEITDSPSTGTDRGWGISGWVIASSAILFLLGFLMGKRRNRAHTVSPASTPAQNNTAAHEDAVVAHPSAKPSTMTPAAVDSPSTGVKQTPLAEVSAHGVHITSASRPPATALPTPGLLASRGRPIKRQQIKSAGNANIDLAKIYLSMGDPSTAQMVLQQVMEEGTEVERTAARQLLQEMI